MVQTLADELIRTIDEAAIALRALPETVASAKPRPEVWSIKELVGHLVDSAANNHQRFVRAPHHEVFTWPEYKQEEWVRSQDHQHRPWLELVDFWVLYNHHLAHLIRRIPEEALGIQCQIGSSAPVTLAFLLQDYLVHLRHHLRQIETRRYLASE